MKTEVVKIQTAYLRRRFLPELVGAVGVTMEEDESVVGVTELDVPLESSVHGADFIDILMVSILCYGVFTKKASAFSCRGQ